MAKFPVTEDLHKQALKDLDHARSVLASGSAKG
jgi:hypothetical protein